MPSNLEMSQQAALSQQSLIKILLSGSFHPLYRPVLNFLVTEITQFTGYHCDELFKV